eukprot:Phypoly_transcript_00188.p1 GENE.Phypoly_transcript_00188~~Phypoly_transcript_00188.p1  ORF type:complete len:1137 (+),score=241.31 Phypoly_transcript_00188:2692-6102(+)
MSPWASHQHTAALVLSDTFYCEVSKNPFPPIPDVIRERLEAQVTIDVPPPYGEIDSLVISSLRTDAQVLSQSLLRLGLTIEDLEYFNEETATMETASRLATAVYDSCLPKLAGKLTPEILDGLDARRRRLLVTIGYIQTFHAQLHISNQGAAAGALVSSLFIPEKITPVVRSLMNSVKCEEDATLQRRGAHSLGHLVVQCTSRKICPNTKILQGLIGALSADRSYTPLVKVDPHNGIKKEKKEKKKENGDEPTVEHAEPPVPEDPALVLARKGAILALRSIVSQYGAQLFDSLPKMWDNMIQPMMAYYETTKDSPFGDVVHVPGSEPQSQQLVDSLQLLRSILPALDASLRQRMETLFKPLIHTVRHPAQAAQEMGGRTLATLCKVHTLMTMQAVITDLLPLLGDTKSVNNRFGAALALHYIIEELGNEVLPYIVLMIIPILGCMSDQDTRVRKTVTGCFATLLKLMPLESGVPDPPGLSPELVAQKASERHFLEQLLDGTKIDKYPVPIKINAELRKYQQDGVNWLAFLNKYKLHGILCDDMGLGKTLQTICIMAGDDFYRRQNYAVTPTANFQPLPSLVVCPPTLVAHWCNEIQKFCEASIKPLSYMGSPSERANLRRQFKDYTILVMSYDILRNDIEHLQTMHFNYCTLDEGHIIKNAKTKITKAVKLIRANHRLILSGTPIQNNVLELWSLFDFLMPGFLGNEKMFNEIYSKPILASKDPKCSPKDQEQGTLAIENLHRQVLPFLLRRLKEDVLADLPPKIIQDYHCDLSPLQVRLYESFGKTSAKHEIDDDLEEDAEDDGEGKKKRPKKKKEEGEGGGGKGQAGHIFQALQYLRKLCCHPLLVLNPKHPEYDAVMRELKQSKASPHDLTHAPKLLALRDLLHECGIGTANAGSLTSSSSSVTSANEIESVASQHRVLIFAQMKAMLDIIESDLLKVHMPSVTYLRMDGSVEPGKRQSIVNQFNSDPTIDLLLLTTHVGGLGLNLTGADTVIFVEHDWNPMKDLQAMDRAHRLGQTKVVNVYRLIARGTLEEKIMGLQKFKLNIANTVINKENTSITTMSTDQLLDLFSYEAANAKKGKAAGSTSGESSTDLMGNVDKKKPGKLKSVLDSLEELWDESQYEEYNLESFLGKL